MEPLLFLLTWGTQSATDYTSLYNPLCPMPLLHHSIKHSQARLTDDGIYQGAAAIGSGIQYTDHPTVGRSSPHT